MGSQLAMEVLRQMALRQTPDLGAIGGVVLMSPDISPDVFISQATDIGRLPEPFVVFSSRRDAALRLSARLTGVDSRLGNLPSIDPVSDLDIVVIDLTDADDAVSRHLAAATSPTIIGFLQQTEAMRRSFEADPSGSTGLVTGTVLFARDATTALLSRRPLPSE